MIPIYTNLFILVRINYKSVVYIYQISTFGELIFLRFLLIDETNIYLFFKIYFENIECYF